ncbi:MAG: hypothetical protein SNI12_07260 [Rikenellaceae bacterium]
MSINKDDLEVNMLRLHDRFDTIEKKIDQLLGKKPPKGEKMYLDNYDIMEITGLAYNTLRRYRNDDRLHPVSQNGRNRYTIEEANRFMVEELHIKLDHCVSAKNLHKEKLKSQGKATPKNGSKNKSNTEEPYKPNIMIDNRDKMPKGFAIIGYSSYNKMISDYHTTIYERFYGVDANGKNDPRNTVISKEEADFVIEKLHFSIVVDNEHGRVWE